MSALEPDKKDLPLNLKTKLDRVDKTLWNFGRWLTYEDEYSDIIISSRIRLARNLKGYPFPNRISSGEAEKLVKKVRAACTKCQALKKASYYRMNTLSEWDKKYFVERRLASPQLVEKDKHSLLVIGTNESLSIMVNEEDHLRIQTIEPGLGILDAWRTTSSIDDELEEYLPFSYSDKFGYLTSCPTNLGTGLRVSIFVHFPGLSLQDNINKVINELPTSEIAVRGFYGEGSESVGNIFQISNQLTLGRTEDSVIDRMTKIALKIIELERAARVKVMRDDRIRVEDIVFRAMGILQNARVITSLESMNLLSNVRLGCELGLLSNINRVALNQLMVLIQPAHLQKIYKKELKPEERDMARAKFIRQNLDS
ncbi:MAG: protein arginine kinase [bacterium]